MIYIIGIAWLLVVIWGLNALRKGSKQLKDENCNIYSDELRSRYNEDNEDNEDRYFESHTL